MSILFYRRPDYVDKAPGYLNDSACQRYVQRTKGSKHKPPMELSFDNILNNRTLPPTTLGDFMDYLLYVAHDAESLQFFLWYRDYCRRFDALEPSQKQLSPAWRFDANNPSPGGWPLQSDEKEIMVSTAPSQPPPVRSFSRLGRHTPQQHSGHMQNASLDFEDFPQAPPHERSESWTAGGQSHERDLAENNARSYVSRSSKAHQNRTSLQVQGMAEGANAQVGLKWQGFSIQPFRTEITRVISHYLAPESPRELNLAHSTRASVLHALQHTTHPSALLPAVQLIETQLRHQSHPNFIRWSICNGNAPKIFFVRTMGVANTILGLVVALLLVLSHASRWWRIFAAPVWFIGISTLVAAYKGLCVILHHNGARNVKPWEDPSAAYSDFTASDSDMHAGSNPPGSSTMTLNNSVTGTPDLSSSGADSLEKGRSPAGSFEYTSDAFVFGGGNEEYVHAEWMDSYRKKGVLRKIFETSVRVQESSVKVLQDRIAKQSQAWAGLCTVVLTVVFVALPKGNFY